MPCQLVIAVAARLMLAAAFFSPRLPTALRHAAMLLADIILPFSLILIAAAADADYFSADIFATPERYIIRAPPPCHAHGTPRAADADGADAFAAAAAPC